MVERRFQLVGPYARIHKHLMSFPADWKPTPVFDDEDIDIDEIPGGDMPFIEISLEGPAGTGKTFFEGVLLEDLHRRYPRLRSVVIRKTRVSLTDSFLQVFEEKVLGLNHPVLLRGASRANRSEYVWDIRDSSGVTRLAGMDNSTRLFSTQYDVAIVVEGIEFTEDEYQSLYRAMRNDGAPFKLIMCDTNPGNVNHFLNTRPEKKDSTMERVLTKHHHNPTLYNPRTGKMTAKGRQYMKILDQLTGVLRRRLRDGEWCSALGAIYEVFDKDIHMIDPGKLTEEQPYGENMPMFDYFMLGVDFGWHDCKCVQVWGVTATRDSILVAEWYGTHVKRSMLAGWIAAAHDEFRFVRGVADHNPEDIAFINESLGWRGGRKKGNLIQKAQKGKGSVSAGLELVIDLMGDYERGKRTKIRFSTKSRRYICPELTAASKPMGVVDEIPGYVWHEPKPGEPPVDKPDAGCVDHGCDTMRYVQSEIWTAKFTKAKGRLTAAQAFSQAELAVMTDEDHESYVEKFAD